MADPLASTSRPDRQPPSPPSSCCAHRVDPPDPAPLDSGNHVGVPFHELSRRDPTTTCSSPTLLLQQRHGGNPPVLSCTGVASSVHGLTGSHDWGAGNVLSCSTAPLLYFSSRARASRELIDSHAVHDPRWFKAPTASSSCQVTRSIGSSGCFAVLVLLLPPLASGRATSVNTATHARMTTA